MVFRGCAMKPEAERSYYTVAEAANQLDVSPATVWRWIEAQILPAYRIGPRRIRIRKEDLAQVIQRRQKLEPSMDQASRQHHIFANYDPEHARRALAQSAGALAHVNWRELVSDLEAQREQDSTGRPS
jgi:excisionase family DNA binding protein